MLSFISGLKCFSTVGQQQENFQFFQNLRASIQLRVLYVCDCTFQNTSDNNLYYIGLTFILET